MEPGQQQPNNGVWISREEYERLRQVQVQPGSVVNPGGAVQTATPYAAVAIPAAANGSTLRAYEIAGAAVGVLTFLGFVVDGLEWAATLGLMALVGLGVLGYLDVVRSRKRVQTAAPRSTTFKLLSLLGIIAAVVVLGPILFYGGMIVLFIIICTIGGCRGS